MQKTKKFLCFLLSFFLMSQLGQHTVVSVALPGILTRFSETEASVQNGQSFGITYPFLPIAEIDVSGTCTITPEDDADLHDLCASIALENGSAHSTTVLVVLAEYNASGKMVGCQIKPLTIDGEDSIKTVLSVDADAEAILGIYIMNEEGRPLTQKISVDRSLLDAAARYEISDAGQFSIKTNLNSDKWNGYSILAVTTDSNGTERQYTQSGSGVVTFACPSDFFDECGRTALERTELYVFKGQNSHEDYQTFYDTLDGHEAAIAALGTQVVGCFDLTTRIFTQNAESGFLLTDVSIGRDEEHQQETYVISIDASIQSRGRYGLHYTPVSGGGRGQSSNLERSKGALVYTCGIDFFAEPGAVGTFCVTHSLYHVDESGNIVCSVTRSNELEYIFPPKETPDLCGNGSMSLTLSQKVFSDLSDQTVSLVFANPARATQELALQIMVQDRVVAQVEKIAPGQQINTLRLISETAELIPGVYEGVFRIWPYDPESGEVEMVQIHIPIIFTVQP